MSGKCDRNRYYLYYITGSARSSTPMHVTSNPLNRMHGPNYYPTPLMQASVSPPHVPKHVSDPPQTKVSPTPIPHIKAQPDNTTYFFRRAKEHKIPNVPDATNSESAHARYHESDVAPTAFPKTSSPPKPNVLNNSPSMSIPLYHFMFINLGRSMTKSI